MSEDVREAEEASGTAEKPRSTRSFKDLTLGEVGVAIDLIKKFWAVLVAISVCALGAFLYIAPASALKAVTCKLERQAHADEQRATVVLLSVQQTERSRRETALANLKMILLETMLENKDTQLKLEKLRARMDELISEAHNELVQGEPGLKSANADLAAALQRLDSCGSGS